jgi:hypothetical protein
VSSIGEQPAAEYFGIDTRAASLCMIEPFKNEHRSTFTHYESISVQVERPACERRFVVLRQHTHIVETSCKKRVDRFGATGQHHVGLPVAKGANGF